MPQTLEQRLNAIASAIGADVKALRLADGDLSSLSTAANGNLVDAINEVFALANSGTGIINDASGDGEVAKTWSANKIFDEIAAAIAGLRTELRAGAGAALDTFAEVAAQLAADESAAAALSTAVNNRIRFDAAQVLSAAEKAQARTNMGAADASLFGNTDLDLVAIYTAAKA